MKENKMGVMEMKKLILTMSFPIMISMLVQALYNIIDSMFVARVSEAALAAVSLCYPVQMILIAVACGTGVGVNALLSRYLGEKKYKEANQIALHGLFLAICNWLIFAVLGMFFSEAFLRIFSSDEQILQMGISYMKICTLFSFGVFVQITYERIMQSTGNTIYNMIIQGVGALINIILDPIFIFGYFGLPAFGVAGAAIATVIGQFSAASLAFVLFKKYNTHLHISFKKFRVDFHVISQLYSIAIPSSVMMCLPSILVSLLNGILSSISQSAVAFFGVYYKLQTFIYMPTSGIVQGIITT